MALAEAPPAVFRIWNFRLGIELEAANLFYGLAEDLFRVYGENDPVARLARAAGDDELRHAQLCRAILKHSPEPLSEPAPRPQTALGPAHLNRRERILYTCVALGCVTESLSTALLTEMQSRAEAGQIKDTVHQILKDEVNHSRIGWAEIARAKRSADLSGLSRYVPAMIEEAVAGDVAPMLAAGQENWDLSRWGILAPAEAKNLMDQTLRAVVIPGLVQHGIPVNLSL